MYNNNSGFFVLFHKVLMLNTQWWTELNWDRFGSGLAYYIIRRGIFIISAKQQQNLFRFFVHSLGRARVKEGAGMEGVSTAGPIPPPLLSRRRWSRAINRRRCFLFLPLLRRDRVQWQHHQLGQIEPVLGMWSNGPADFNQKQ